MAFSSVLEPSDVVRCLPQVALSEGRNLLARVLFAEHYGRLVFDRELHDAQLRKVLDAEPDLPDLTLQNTYAKKQARQLLDGADDYF